MVAQNMRPKWRADTYSIPMSNGVYLRGNRSRLFLKGKSLYPLLIHLIPNLDGRMTLEEITEDLDADRKKMLTNLIEKLFAHGFLGEGTQDQLQTLHRSEQEAYAPELALIESWQTGAVSRFEYFRNQRLLLIGSEAGCTALLRAGLQCGLRQIEVLAAPPEEDKRDSGGEILTALVHKAAEQQTQVHLRSELIWDDEAEVRSVLRASDAILHLAEEPLLARAQLLNRLCLEEGKVLMQGIRMADRVWLGPLVYPESGNCWECAWRRLRVNLTALATPSALWEFQDESLAAGEQSITEVHATLLANRLVFALFRYFTQIGWPEMVSGLEVFDLATCQSESHAFLPHPHCLACQHPIVPTAARFLEQLQQVQRREAIDPATFLANVADCVDEQSGLFATFENSDFVQVPLAVYQVTLPDPLLKQSAALSVVGVSSETGEARLRTALQACACYASRLMDRRRLLSSDTIQGLRETFPVAANEQLSERPDHSPEDEQWTWALDLQTHETVLVPAARVFSPSDRQERGVAAGPSWEEALCYALLDWCNYLTVAEMRDARRAFLQVDLARAPLTSEGAHLFQLLKAAGESVAVYDITGSLEVPTFATFVDEKVVAYTSHCDVAQALNLGLERALQRYQAAQFQQPIYAPASVPDFPTLLRSEQCTVPRSTVPQAWPERRAWLLERLQANGLRALVVPLDHDPALSRILPFIVRVLVGTRELQKGE